MKRLLFKFALLALVISAYVGSPFVAAWQIREAVRNGDASYLQTAIDWPSVRETLKPTLSRLALNLPLDETQPAPKPGMWQRMKAYWGKGAVDRAIESYVTPEGLPQLFALRKGYRDVTGAIDESKTLAITERMKRAWARVKRAEFTSFTTFEMDMTDKQDETRLYLGKLELTGRGWMLKELRIKSLTTADGSTAGPATADPVEAQPLLTQPQANLAPMSAKRGWGFISRAEAAEFGPAFGERKPSLWQRAKAFARGETIRGDR